jgi:hypothetical protein
MIHGLVPGPDMLSKHLHITYSMVWSIALANILGAGLCYLFSEYFARLATLRYTLIMPAVLGIIYIGAFQGARNWGDLWTLLIFGVLGWTMKQMKFPRPPLVLGLVLGEIVERYLFISIQRYGITWFQRPIVAGIFALALLGLMRPLIQDVRAHGGIKGMLSGFGAPRFTIQNLYSVFLIGLIGFMVVEATSWNLSAKIVPLIVGGLALAFCTIGLLNDIFRKPEDQMVLGLAGAAQKQVEEKAEAKIHMDLESDTQHIPVHQIAVRALLFFGWLLAFMGSMAVIGLIPTVPLFVIMYMRLEGTERWSIVVPYAVLLTLFIWIVFDQLLTIPWPPTYLGGWVPALKGLIPSV